MSPLLSINTTHGYFPYAFSLTVFQAALLPHMAACLFYYCIYQHIHKKKPISRFLFSSLLIFYKFNFSFRSKATISE